MTRTWGSTGKEVERSTFWIEGRLPASDGRCGLIRSIIVPRIWKRFKLSFIICLAIIAMMIIFPTNVVPFVWRIPGWEWALIVPLALVVGCHLLFPVRLNTTERPLALLKY